MFSEGFSLLIFVLLLGVIVWLFWETRKKGSPKEEQLGAVMERLKIIGEQNRELRETIDSKLSETHQATRDQLGHSARQIADVVAGLTKLEETSRQVVDYSAQLQNLQDILKNPKQRGILGEYYLETVLKNVLPPGMYQMQYSFRNGEIVDAAVFVDKKVVPVDSKFSLDNYNRFIQARGEERSVLEKAFVNDLKLRIQETAKYIRPEENTMDFAFMFIPSEGIYYDLLTNQVGSGEEENLIQRAASKYKVIIVSPTSFLAYLQTVLQGLRALQIEENAREIRTNVEKLGKHLVAFDEFMQKLGGSMSTTVNHFNSAYKELGKIDKDVSKITESEKQIEPLLVERPREE